jgi:hypothetical protein
VVACTGTAPRFPVVVDALHGDCGIEVDAVAAHRARGESSSSASRARTSSSTSSARPTRRCSCTRSCEETAARALHLARLLQARQDRDGTATCSRTSATRWTRSSTRAARPEW